MEDEDKYEDKYEEVNECNELLYRRAFCVNVKHSVPCVEDTVIDMAELMKKTCAAYGSLPVDQIIEQMGVVQFDQCLRKILDQKDCGCN